MNGTAPSRLPALTSALPAAGTLAVLVLFWGAAELRFLALPLVSCGALLTLSRLALRLRSTTMAERTVRRVRTGGEAARVVRLAEVLPAAQRLLADLGWMALGLGLLSSLPALPGVVSGYPWAPDVSYLIPYLSGLDSLAVWGILFLAPFIAVRAVAETRPDIGAIGGFPWIRLAAFGGAYVLLGDGGLLSAAFALNGFRVLLGLGLALGFSWVALVIRRAMPLVSSGNPARLRTALYLAEAAWIVALLGAMTALPFAVENAMAHLDDAGAGLLNATYLALLLPFTLVICAGVLRPTVGRVLGVPVGHLVALAVVHVVFSGAGVLSTAFAIDVSGIFAALIVATALAYAAMALRNAATLDAAERYAPAAGNASRALSVLAVAGAFALVVGVALGHLPVASAVLLDRPWARDFGESSLPFFGGLYDARYSIALLSFTMVLAFRLPSALQGDTLLRHQPMLSAVSYAAVGCLAWLTASGLSSLGHGFAFGGAIAAAGMFSLALTRLARYAAGSSNPALADAAGWLAASQVRGFVIGAAVAFYVLLLRPVVYEMLWLAALYEYIALMVLLLVVLMNVIHMLRLAADAPEAAEPAWTHWAHHRQVLDIKTDPRSELAGALRQRFLDRGDWKPLWVYLLGLLYRSEAPLDAMLAVCRSLRRSAAASPVRDILDRSGRRAGRAAALEQSLDIVERALASPAPLLGRVDGDDIRQAAASFIDRGTDPEALAVALMIAHCQRGDALEDAVDRWFSLVDAPDPFPDWLTRPWGRSNARLGAALRRLHLVDNAVASLLGEPAHAEPASPSGAMVRGA